MENGNTIIRSKQSMITLQEQIRSACLHSGLSLTELGTRFGCSQSGFSQRLQNGKFTKQELEKMASIMDCQYECHFIFDDGESF